MMAIAFSLWFVATILSSPSTAGEKPPEPRTYYHYQGFLQIVEKDGLRFAVYTSEMGSVSMVQITNK